MQFLRLGLGVLALVLVATSLQCADAQTLVRADDGSGVIRVLFQSGWRAPNMHYCSGAACTSVPGVAMQPSADPSFPFAAGWFTLEQRASTLAFVFNNGAGVWDNNGNLNYKLSTPGTYTVVSKVSPPVSPPSSIACPARQRPTLQAPNATIGNSHGRRLALDRSRLVELPGFASRALGNSRTIRVYLPPSYTAALAAATRYPVLYMQDGQNLFPPGGAFGCWFVNDAVDALTLAGQIEEVIVVGIDSTADRTSEYNLGDGGRVELYARFVIDELLPAINARFRTRTGAAHTAIMGSSYGGMAALFMGWRHADVFGKAGVLSPTLAWNQFGLLNEIKRTPTDGDNIVTKRPVAFWVYAGDREKIDPQGDGLGNYGEWALDLVDTLSARGWVVEGDLMLAIAQGAGHNEDAWAAHVRNPILFFFRTQSELTPTSLSARMSSPELDAAGVVKQTYLFAQVTYSNGLVALVPNARTIVTSPRPSPDDPLAAFTRYQLDRDGAFHLKDAAANPIRSCPQSRVSVPVTVQFRALVATTFFDIVAASSTKTRVNIEILAPAWPSARPSSSIFMVGNFGAWSFTNAQLELVSSASASSSGSSPLLTFVGSFVFRKAQTVEFKLTAGAAWAYEELRVDGSAAPNRVLTVPQSSAADVNYLGRVDKWRAVPQL